MHHALFSKLYPIFDRTFIYDSYSCRIGKGVHRGVKRLQAFARKAGKNNTRICWVLKCDIKKFFDNIDHAILMQLVAKRVRNKNALWLVGEIIDSFHPGLPLGNITSQLFANIYLHELDTFMKHALRLKYYIRYCDDFIILHENKDCLKSLVPVVNNFLVENLKMQLHPNKIVLRKHRQGVDFLGYVSFPKYTILRPKTKRRLFNKITAQNVQSYLGILKHCNGYKIRQQILKTIDGGRTIA